MRPPRFCCTFALSRNRATVMSSSAGATTDAAEHPASDLLQTLTPGASASRHGSIVQGHSAFEVLASADDAAGDVGVDPYANKTIYDFQVLNCYYELYDLSQHKGSVVLICNVASKCKEYTESGYKMLVSLYRKHHLEGFTVLAFPCNEFGNGEPGNEDEIAENISCVYPQIGEVDFPIMAKVEVNGEHELPLFTFLKNRIRGTLGQSAVRWNFTCFLIDQKGAPFARFCPGATLEEIDARVVELLRPAPGPAAQDGDSSAPRTEDGLAASGVDRALSPDDHAGCTTLPPPRVDGATMALATALATALPAGLTVSQTHGANGVGAFEDVYKASFDSSTLFNATAATLEGVNLAGSPTNPPVDTPLS